MRSLATFYLLLDVAIVVGVVAYLSIEGYRQNVALTIVLILVAAGASVNFVLTLFELRRRSIGPRSRAG
jgi:hypothetical protein